MADSERLRALLFSAAEPSREIKRRFERFVELHYKERCFFMWVRDPNLTDGFRLEVGSDVYDWSIEGRLQQLRDTLLSVKAKDGQDIIPLLKKAVDKFEPQPISEEIGTVVTIGDGVATVSGITGAEYGEILLFDGDVRGMVLNITKKELGCILFDGDESVAAGSRVHRTGKSAGIPVGERFIGRVTDALGVPIDGKGDIISAGYRPVESPAPGIAARQPVNKPLKTGLLSIDSMFPIGRGQRELIIGDRQTGKTAIAVDTILNQKNSGVICIYVAIGQKASSVRQTVRTLEENGAMNYTIVLLASASDSAPLQYIAPYAGCAMAEYFMDQGKDVLIIYDDLSKHAVAYRSLSLVLGRSPGREAYPGDVFYLHSRLLERSAHLSHSKGGGSMTALPIVETLAGNVSAYIPTNIISITDGQIFLDTALFRAGQRPAVNVGLSVSRVGGDAMTPCLKAAAGSLRLELAQYREMKVFTQFSNYLDDEMQKSLRFGEILMNILKQEQYRPYEEWEQVIILVAAINRALDDLSDEHFEETLRGICKAFSEARPDIVERIKSGSKLSEADRNEITEFAKAACHD